MNCFEEDTIVSEVRRSRAKILSDFGGDAKKLCDYLMSQRANMEADGWRYETTEELEARKARHRQQREAEQRRIASI